MATTKKTDKKFDDMTEEELHGDIVPFASEYVPVDYEDALRHFEDELGGLVYFESSPYHVADKATLIGKPFIIVDIRTYDEDKWKYGVPWVTLLCVTKEPVKDQNGVERNRVVINDGGSGIASQIMGYLSRTDRRKGLLVEGGLRVSEYTYDQHVPKGTPNAIEKDGEWVLEMPAKTYYIS